MKRFTDFRSFCVLIKNLPNEGGGGGERIFREKNQVLHQFMIHRVDMCLTVTPKKEKVT